MPLIEISELTKRYGQFTALEGLSLTIDEGEVFTLLGPNGAGKTTTIRLLMGILQPSAGRASVDGLDCGAERPEVMRRVGYVPDEPFFYDFLRASEILSFVARMHGLDSETGRARIDALADRLGLTDDLGEYAVNFSHGMKKKLAAACALLHEPRLLVLDEPTNGLDPYATRTMHELIAAHAATGGSVFLCTHLLDQAERLATRVGIIQGGRLRACGRLDELRDRARAEASLEEVFFAVTGEGEAAGAVAPPEPEGQA